MPVKMQVMWFIGSRFIKFMVIRHIIKPCIQECQVIWEYFWLGGFLQSQIVCPWLWDDFIEYQSKSWVFVIVFPANKKVTKKSFLVMTFQLFNMEILILKKYQAKTLYQELLLGLSTGKCLLPYFPMGSAYWAFAGATHISYWLLTELF